MKQLETVESDVPTDINGLLSQIDDVVNELWSCKARGERTAFFASAARLGALAQSLNGAEFMPSQAKAFFDGAKYGRFAADARPGGER